MSSPTSPNTMTDAIRNAVLYQLLNVHTAMPGKIVSYDFSTKKAQIQPMVDKKYTDGTTEPMPVLNNVPVIFPFAGGASITFPVNPGDFCLVICCERSIDNFLANGQQAAPTDPRKFDLSDGVAIMGLLPFNETSPVSTNNEFLIAYGGSEIKIDSTGNVTINTANKVAIGNATTEVLDVLSQALGFIANPVGVVVPSVPFTGPLADAASAAALQVQLNLIKGTIT